MLESEAHCQAQRLSLVLQGFLEGKGQKIGSLFVEQMQIIQTLYSKKLLLKSLI